MKLISKKNGSGNLSSYVLNIKLTDARILGFIDENNTSKELEKIIDTKNNRIIIKLKEI